MIYAGEKNKILLSRSNLDKASTVFSALSSPVRLKILNYLLTSSGNVSQISNALDIPISTAADHIRILEDAQLIVTQEVPGIRGSQKLCGLGFEKVIFDIYKDGDSDNNIRQENYDLDIGLFYDAEICEPCGMASEKRYLGVEDKPSTFFSADRNEAQILWFNYGYLEYRIPRTLTGEETLEEFIINLELCSEALGYNEDWPSDVFFQINDLDIGTVHLLGDYGGRRGRLNPKWWNVSSTQYGLLHWIKVTPQGTFIDGQYESSVTTKDIQKWNKPYWSIKFGVRKDAEYCGGLNLFGKQFGDFNQGIVCELRINNNSKESTLNPPQAEN